MANPVRARTKSASALASGLAQRHRHPGLVDPVGAAGDNEDGAVALSGSEDDRLGNLRHGTAAGLRRIGGTAGGIGHLNHLVGEAELDEPILNTPGAGGQFGHDSEISGFPVYPASSRERLVAAATARVIKAVSPSVSSIRTSSAAWVSLTRSAWWKIKIKNIIL